MRLKIFEGSADRMASCISRSAPQLDGCHWRLVGECLTLSVRKSIMAPRYSDPGSVQRSRHTSLSKSGVYGQGLPPVMLNFEYAETVMVETGSLKLYQNRPGPVQGKCCLKNAENFGLTLFWYSPTYRQNWPASRSCDIFAYHKFPVLVIFSIYRDQLIFVFSNIYLQNAFCFHTRI